MSGKGRPRKTDEEKHKRSFSGYFPPELMDALKADAERERRTMNAHAAFILETYLKNKGALK